MLTFPGRVFQRVAAALGLWAKAVFSFVLRLAHRGAPTLRKAQQQGQPPVSPI